MNKQLRRLGIGLMACFVILFAQLNWLHVLKADSYNTDPRNDREIIRDFTRPRGAILTADGTVVARSVPSNDRFTLQREYPTGQLFAGVGGFFSFVYGTDGVERQYNDVLAGQTPQQKLRGFANLFNDEVNTGDVQLTLRNDIQTVAQQALGDKEGSVVVSDPRTGAILAMYSNPTYDPNTIATHDFDAAKAAREALLADPAKPLLMNAYQERYMPGSTFKIITATAGLASGQYDVSSFFPPTDQFVVPARATPIKNYGGEVCGGTFPQVFARSCNTAFAEIGTTLGPEAMVGTAEGFGFNKDVPIDLPAPAQSFFPSVQDFLNDVPNGVSPKLATSSFGQDEPAATPLQMNMAAAAVANKGVLMTPHVMGQTRDSRRRGAGDVHAQAVAHCDDARDRGHDDGLHDRRRTERHRPLLPAARQWHPGGGQDGHGPAAPRRRPRSVARVDHGLRPGRGATSRRDGVREGDARGVLRSRRHRRRPGRQAGPRLRHDVAGPAQLSTCPRPRRASSVGCCPELP